MKRKTVFVASIITVFVLCGVVFLTKNSLEREIISSGSHHSVFELMREKGAIEWGAGTNVWFAQYYDISNNLFSDTYQCPLAIRDYVVAYVEYSDDFVEVNLVVRDIFDESKYYREFSLDDVSSAVNPVNEVKFIGNKEMEVTYLTGEDCKTKTEVIQLD